MTGAWLLLGWIVVFGLPLVVAIAAIAWQPRIPKDRSVDGIRRRIDEEDV
ncbi:hypothetical protein [Nocardia sp. NPDC048505]